MSMSLPSNMISQHGKELKIIKGYKMRFHKMLNDNEKKVLCNKNMYSLHKNRYE
jgi:hypothetical protein